MAKNEPFKVKWKVILLFNEADGDCERSGSLLWLLL